MRTLFAPLLPAFVAAALALMPLSATAQDAAVADMTRGDADAPVTFVEYASFTCPHCATFHAEVLPQLKRDYIDTGKVRYTYREVFFTDRQGNVDRPALWASMVARCGGEMRYFGIVDMVYARQGEWSRAGDGFAIVDSLRRIGRAAGLTDPQLDACLSDGEKAQALYNWYQANADRDGVQGTPSFMIDGEMYSNRSYNELRAILDDKIAAAEG